MQPLRDRAEGILLQQYESAEEKELHYLRGFIALGLARLDWKRGVSYFGQLLRQFGSGDYYTSKRTLLHPPLFGFVMAGFYEMAPDEPAAASFLKMTFGQVLDFHRHLYQNRDPLEDGLLVITHPAEDLLLALAKDPADPAFSSQSDLQRQDPLFNAMLAWSNECLMEIGSHLGEDITEILLWNELTVFSLNEVLWWEEEAVFRAFDLKQQLPLPLEGLAQLMPMIGEIPDQDQAEMMLEVLKSDQFNYLLAPLRPENEYDFPAGTRISIIANWLLYHGLWRFGMSAAAGQLRRFSLELMERYGFREVYDLSTGIPVFDTWEPECAAVAGLCLAWLEEE